jgi:ribose-phosphate pyrophosphokinase
VAARKLVAQGLQKPECVVVHALFAEDAWNELVPLFSRITSTEAVPHLSNRIKLSSMVAEAIIKDLKN